MSRLWDRRKIKQLILALLTLVALALAAIKPEWFDSGSQIARQNQPGFYSVIRFDDGDTIAVDMNGQNETVRFIGVDTPETHDPRKAVQCFGYAATVYTKNLVGKSRVRLEADSLNTNRDRYGRLLRYIYLPDGTLVNAKIIQDGYGFAYTLFPFEKADEFRSYERQAREASQGLWSACEITDNGAAKQTNPITD